MFHKVGEGNFWNTDWFSPNSIAPSKPRRAPSPIPDTRLLFEIQEDALKVLAELRRLPQDLDEDTDYAKARKAIKYRAENTYKLINRYLRNYVNNQPNQ